MYWQVGDATQSLRPGIINIVNNNRFASYITATTLPSFNMADTTTSTDRPRPAQLDALPTELRLRALEARVRGAPASTLLATGEPDADADAVTLSHRTAALRAKLDEVAEASPPIKQFLENCE